MSNRKTTDEENTINDAAYDIGMSDRSEEAIKKILKEVIRTTRNELLEELKATIGTSLDNKVEIFPHH